MTEAMADTPDIVIRTPEEREASRMWFVEVPHMNGMALALLNQKTKVSGNATTLLLFEDREAAVLWAALRVKELSCEGVEVYKGVRLKTLREFPDKRVAVPSKEHRSYALDAMLEW